MPSRLLLFLLLPLLAQDKPGPKELELKRSIAAGWAELASWCRSRGLDAESRPMIEEALSLDPDNAKAKAMKAKAVEAKPSESALKELPAKREPYAKKIASLYLQLSREKRPPEAQAATDGYVIRAFELDAAAAGPAVDAGWKDAASRKDWTRARRFLETAEKAKSDPARVRLLAEVALHEAETKPVLRQCATHAMKYWLALPKDWSPSRKWPLVVGVEGAGCDWQNMIGSLLGSRGDHPFMIVTPVTFSNTNAIEKEKYPYSAEVLDAAAKAGRMTFDQEGLLAVIAELQKEFGADEKVRITGFSGGGLLCWQMVFAHPEMLAAAAPACPNFAGAGKGAEAPDREKLPIRVFQGDKDPYWSSMLERQWAGAKALLDQNGYKNYSHVMLPGVGHANCAKEVMDFFAAPDRK